MPVYFRLRGTGCHPFRHMGPSARGGKDKVGGLTDVTECCRPDVNGRPSSRPAGDYISESRALWTVRGTTETSGLGCGGVGEGAFTFRGVYFDPFIVRAVGSVIVSSAAARDVPFHGRSADRDRLGRGNGAGILPGGDPSAQRRRGASRRSAWCRSGCRGAWCRSACRRPGVRRSECDRDGAMIREGFAMAAIARVVQPFTERARYEPLGHAATEHEMVDERRAATSPARGPLPLCWRK